MSTHAYVLIRDTGNVSFYNSGHSDDYQHVLQLGEIVRQYLSHRDEAGTALRRIEQTFGIPRVAIPIDIPSSKTASEPIFRMPAAITRWPFDSPSPKGLL